MIKFNLEEEHKRITTSNNINQPNNDLYSNLLKQEEEKQYQAYRQIKQDEELAKLMQSLEVKEKSQIQNSEVKNFISEDEKLCYLILKEEKLKEEQRKEEETRKRQIEEDAKLAKKLENQEKRSVIPPPPPPNINNYPNYNSYNKPYNGVQKSGYTVYPNSIQVTTERRQHALQIHNLHCFCGKTATYNNNHIFDIHKKHCGCELFPVHNYWNEGRKHQHDHRCCTVNHIHSIACRCSYRDHEHDHLCCNRYHNHVVTCHCSQK